MEDNKKLLRAVVRSVHPDLFTDFPSESQTNSESLKLLNHYVDEVSKDARPRAVSLDFWVKSDEALSPVHVDLVENGSLAPLFFGFGLISEEEYVESGSSSAFADHDLLEWLRAAVDQAVEAADRHHALKNRIDEARALLESKYELAEIQFGQEICVSKKEQNRQLEVLRVLNHGLKEVCEHDNMFSGLNFCLHHPESCPLDFSFQARTGSSDRMRVQRISSDGQIHILADIDVIEEALLSVAVDRARLLARLRTYWVRRARDLTVSVKDLLRVEDVMCDTSSSQNAQNFVLWAGHIMAQRSAVNALLLNRRLNFSVLVHSDDQVPMIDHLASSGILHVRSDCPPRTILDFLASSACNAASQEAREIKNFVSEEDALLEEVRAALGAKQVIRVCPSYDRDLVLAAADRLIQNAEIISHFVDLSNASIALDDCYQMWESGFISIPCDFQLQDLQPQLRKMLTSGYPADEESYSESPARNVSARCYRRPHVESRTPHRSRSHSRLRQSCRAPSAARFRINIIPRARPFH